MPQQNIINSPNPSVWTSYALVIGGSTTNPTTGAIVQNNAWYLQNGKLLTILYNFSQSSAGTVGSGAYLFPIPSNFTINTSIATPLSSSSGVATGQSLGISSASIGTAFRATGSMFSYNSTNLQMTISGDNGTDLLVPLTMVGGFGAGFYNLSNAQLGFSFSAVVPIN
jgi:hypothetical protein